MCESVKKIKAQPSKANDNNLDNLYYLEAFGSARIFKKKENVSFPWRR
jgi:hypothetical protein